MINRIFATGYAGCGINELKPPVKNLGAIPVDIRFTSYSEVMFWRKVYLKTLLVEKYLHTDNLGKCNFKEHENISI